MTVSTTSVKSIGLGNGATTLWTYNFLINIATDVQVTYTDASGVNTTIGSSLYSITGLANPAGGTLTYPLAGPAIASGTKLTISRNAPDTQLIDLVSQGSFSPDVVETGLDNAVLELQQTTERGTRSIRAPISDSAPSMLLPTDVVRASKFLAFDASGNVSLVTGTPATPSPWLNVKDYGAKGDGTTDDTASIQAAINACFSAGGGFVWLPVGTYIVNGIIIKSNVNLAGSGRYATWLKGKAGTTGPIVVTDLFSTLTGGGTSAGPTRWSLRDLGIDGNKASRASGNGLSSYGWDWSLENVDIANCPSIGIYSEWALTNTAPAFPPGVTGEPECHIKNLRVYGCTGDGIDWFGPNDAQMHQLLIYVNGGYGIRANSSATSTPVGLMLSQCHIYHCGNWGLDTNVVMSAIGLESESMTASGGVRVTGGGAIFGANWWLFNNTGVGLDIESTYRTVVSGISSNNNTSHGILINGPATLSNLMLVQNGGDGLNFGASSSSSQISNALAQLNTGKGFSVQGNDQTITGISAFNNGAAGVALASPARLTLQGQAIGNVTQLTLGTLGNGCNIEFTLNSTGGSGTWTGTPGNVSNVCINSSGTDSIFKFVGPLVMPSFAKASLPTAANYTGGMIFVTDDIGGSTPAFSDGTNWRRVADRNVIS